MAHPGSNEALSQIDVAFNDNNFQWSAYTAMYGHWPKWYSNHLGELAVLVGEQELHAAGARIVDEHDAAQTWVLTSSFLIVTTIDAHDRVEVANIPEDSVGRTTTAYPLRTVVAVHSKHGQTVKPFGESGTRLQAVSLSIDFTGASVDLDTLTETAASIIVSAIDKALD